MSANPLVSVVIVNWNGARHLRICLPSLLAQSYQELEIIVVDNASCDDSAKVAQEFEVRWLTLKANLGLAPGLNTGAAAANGEFLLFVNNDMRFDPEFVAELLAPLRRDEGIFCADAMQFSWDGGERGHLAARLTKNPVAGKRTTELVPGLHFHQQDEIAKSKVFMASAACMMARRSIFEKLGGFDARLPLGYEDVEICWRAWACGHSTMYVPTAICWHRVGSSTESMAALRFAFRGVLTGRLLLATKLLPGRYAWRTWMVSVAGLAKDILQLRWGFAVDRCRILLRMGGLLGPLLREKKRIFADAGHPAETQLRMLLELADEDAGAE
jgi:GT2 family glycosyltransferase